MKKQLLEKSELNSKMLATSDLNGDNLVNTVDIVLFKKYLLIIILSTFFVVDNFVDIVDNVNNFC